MNTPYPTTRPLAVAAIARWNARGQRAREDYWKRHPPHAQQPPRKSRKYPLEWTSFPSDGAHCPVTVWTAVTPRANKQGVVTEERRPCGEPLAGEFCANHLADRERLS